MIVAFSGGARVVPWVGGVTIVCLRSKIQPPAYVNMDVNKEPRDYGINI